MQVIVDYWYIFFSAVVLLIIGGIFIFRFLKMPTAEQVEMVSEWLLWAVSEAERKLGGGTGQLKLRQVYDLFVVRFPWLVKIISFNKFKKMVDSALVEMRKMLQENKAVKAFIEGGTDNGS